MGRTLWVARSESGAPANPPGSPTLWLKPSGISATGGNIDSWTNSGSLGGSVTQTGTNRPTVTTISSKNCALLAAASSQYFDSTLAVNLILANAGWTWACIVKPTTHTDVHTAGYDKPNVGIDRTQGNVYPVTLVSVGITAGQWAGGADRQTGAVSVSDGTAYFVMAWYDGTNLNLKVGTTLATTTASGNPVISGQFLRIGCDYTTAHFIDAAIAEPIAYNTALNSTDRATLESYLRGQYTGIT